MSKNHVGFEHPWDVEGGLTAMREAFDRGEAYRFEVPCNCCPKIILSLGWTTSVKGAQGFFKYPAAELDISGPWTLSFDDVLRDLKSLADQLPSGSS